MAVDDEPAVLAAVARDLLAGYAESYRNLRDDTRAPALQHHNQLSTRGEHFSDPPSRPTGGGFIVSGCGPGRAVVNKVANDGPKCLESAA